MNIATTYNVADWVYGYTAGEAYSGAVERIEASADGTTTVKYKISNRAALVDEADLATSKANLITQMSTIEDDANTARKAANTVIINALPTS